MTSTYKRIRQAQADSAAARRKKAIAANRVRLLRRAYGWSYFGSGGAWGRVIACGNCRLINEDTGFVVGPRKVDVIDPSRPAEFRATGGDSINGGRRWTESGRWDPVALRWND